MILEDVKFVPLGDRITLCIELPVWRFDGNWAGNRDWVMCYGLGTPRDIGQCVNRVEVILLLFLDEYALLVVGMCKKWFPAVHFQSHIVWF